jgi:predicted NACHT family NTPase
MTGLEIVFGAGATALSAQFLTWIREKHGDKIKEKVQKGFDKFNWTTAQGKYRDKIIKDFGTIRLIGSDEKIDLNDIFTDVYLLKNSDAFEYHERLENRDISSDDDIDRRFGGADYVKNNQKNLYILGKPGAGKTTFLKHIAVQASNNQINKIPVFIYLRDWARKPNVDLFDFLVKQFDIRGFPEAKYLIEYLLEFGKLIILLDGLDEVPEAENIRRDVIAHIKDFVGKYSNNQFLMTCRIASIDYSFEDFTYLRMADFTAEQIECYVNNWFKGKSQEKLELFKQGLFNPNNKRFLEMASQPLLLSLLCVNFNETMAFSDNRIEIYEEAISYLLHKWNAFNDVTRDEIFKLSKERKMNMFSEIAAQNIEKGTYYDRFYKHILQDQLTTFLAKLPNAPAKEDIDGEMVIANIESTNGILIERFKNVYSFGHLSFQEYFTARYVRDQNRIEWLLKPENLSNDKWREVIMNTAALLGNSDIFFTLFQESINQIISDELNLKLLIQLANQKASSVKSNKKLNAIRFFYIYLTLLADLGDNIPHSVDFARSLDLAVALDLDFTSDLNLNHDLSRVLVLDRTIDLDLDLSFDYQLYVCKKSVFFFSHNRKYIKIQQHTFNKLLSFLEKTIENGKQLKEKVIINDLQKLFGFNKGFNEEDHNLVAETLDNSLRSREMKSDLEFDYKQIEKLVYYFKANKLLLECLQLAVVTDRQAIEDKMFLPIESD